MKKQSPVLLDNAQVARLYTIDIVLQQGRTARMEFNDREVAQSHYDFMRVTGVCGGLPIREIKFNK